MGAARAVALSLDKGMTKLFAAAAFAALFSTLATAEPIDPNDIHVIDGDTIRIYQRQPDVRLVGFNAPETRKADCEAELVLGGRATRFLRDLVRAGHLDFKYVGPVGRGACAWGRDCGTLQANGRDVGDLLIAAGLAVPFVCPNGRCPPTPRPWCAAAR
jgi:endonuclease YncB( thermonuclease family)